MADSWGALIAYREKGKKETVYRDRAGVSTRVCRDVPAEMARPTQGKAVQQYGSTGPFEGRGEARARGDRSTGTNKNVLRVWLEFLKEGRGRDPSSALIDHSTTHRPRRPILLTPFFSATTQKNRFFHRVEATKRPNQHRTTFAVYSSAAGQWRGPMGGRLARAIKKSIPPSPPSAASAQASP